MSGKRERERERDIEQVGTLSSETPQSKKPKLEDSTHLDSDHGRRRENIINADSTSDKSIEITFPSYELIHYPQYENYSPFLSYPSYPGKKQ